MLDGREAGRQAVRGVDGGLADGRPHVRDAGDEEMDESFVAEFVGGARRGQAAGEPSEGPVEGVITHGGLGRGGGDAVERIEEGGGERLEAELSEDGVEVCAVDRDVWVVGGPGGGGRGRGERVRRAQRGHKLGGGAQLRKVRGQNLGRKAFKASERLLQEKGDQVR